MSPEIVIVKLGGSLLSRPDLGSRLRQWLDHWRKGIEPTLSLSILLLVGGGELVDTLRRSAARYSLSDALCHWLAIDLMAVQGRIVAELLGVPVLELTGADTLPDSLPELAVLHPRALLDRKPDSLPASWEITSDSIAAYAAHQLGARRLVLLKSVGHCETSLAEAALAGWVDPPFPAWAKNLDLEWVNLADYP